MVIKSNFHTSSGFSLLETLVAIGVFVIISTSAYQAYFAILDVVKLNRVKIAATNVVNEQFEIARNLPYNQVGVVGSIPSGVIPYTQTLTRDGITFSITAIVRNIDQPFDGTLGGVPNDTSPADNKLVEFTVECGTCKNFTPITFSGLVSPKNLETASANGALFVRVFDANGDPVQSASVHIENNATTTPIVINDVTDANGMLQLVDVPPELDAYEITVSKTGYSTEKTYPVGALGNPNPRKPHATVLLQQVTQISFAIDRVSTLSVSSVTPTCTPVPSFDFAMVGSKLLGDTPDVYKYSMAHLTNGSGLKTVSNLEWDTYVITAIDGDYDLIGINPLSPLLINPNTTPTLQLVAAPKDPNSMLVTIKDGITLLPLTGADVRLEGTGVDSTKTTGRGFLTQTDWSGGAGQENFTNPAQFFASDGNIEINSPAGQIKLRNVFGNYAATGWLESSTFDTGSVSNFYQLFWQPTDMPPDTGANSLKFQVATNNDNSTWNYTGPGGVVDTYYTLGNPTVDAVNNGNQYLRYKTFMSTASTTLTPSISDLSFTFTSSCTPPGQVIFGGLNLGNYTLTISKTGYSQVTIPVELVDPWQHIEVLLNP